MNRKTESNYHIYKKCLIWAGDPLDETRLDGKSVKSLIGKTGAWMLRNVYDWDCGQETQFWSVICDKYLPVEDNPNSKARNQIRRSMRDCDFRIVTPEELVSANGYEVYKSAFSRYREVTTNIESRESWEKNTIAAKGREYWGVFRKEDNLLIAYGITSKSGKCVNMNTLKAIPELMNKHYPYFGLIQTMLEYYIKTQGYRCLNDGERSITEHSGIQPFLEKNFMFRKAYSRMNLYYAPWMRFVVNMLYPFRNILKVSNVKNVLKFEEIARSEKKR